MSILSRFAVPLALALALPLAAQQQRELDPQPIPDSHPNARRAAAVVERLAAGDRAGAIEVLRREGSPEFVANRMEQAVDRAMSRLVPAGRWQIAGFEAAGVDADVIVRLRSGDARENLAVRMRTDPPHHVVGFARVDQEEDVAAAAAEAAAAAAPLT
ncbi:MAG TPA: hypothetical protein VEQ60_20160, partial [Longimicrobium sp.]|nr:hypothetical protein [Longimicrobium sp.]